MIYYTDGCIYSILPDIYFEDFQSTDISNDNFKSNKRSHLPRRIFIGDSSSHVPRIKITERGNPTGNTMSFYVDNGSVKTTGRLEDLDSKEELYYKQLCLDNWDLLLYLYLIDKYNHIEAIEQEFISDCNMRESYKPNNKVVGALANPKVIRNRTTGVCRYTAYSMNQYNNIEPHLFEKAIGGVPKDLGRAY